MDVDSWDKTKGKIKTIDVTNPINTLSVKQSIKKKSKYYR